MKGLNPKTLSEAALALCLAGAVVVWLGLRLDRYLFRWVGMAVIVIGLMGLIFQGSLTHQTLAQSSFSFPPATPSLSASPSPSAKPSPSPSPHKKPAKRTKKATTSSGGYVPPAPPVPQPIPPTGSGGGGGTPPFQGSPVP